MKPLIFICFFVPVVSLGAFWNMQANGEKELIVAVSVVMFFITWIAVEFIEAGLKQ